MPTRLQLPTSVSAHPGRYRTPFRADRAPDAQLHTMAAYSSNVADHHRQARMRALGDGEAHLAKWHRRWEIRWRARHATVLGEQRRRSGQYPTAEEAGIWCARPARRAHHPV
ncbi:MAG: hypothetical protein ACTH0V_00070 [Microbacteriaceae bacterium]